LEEQELMPTDNVNQSGATAAADSARDESAAAEQVTGPDSAAGEPQAASETNQTAQTEDGTAAIAQASAPTSEQPDNSEAATAPLVEQQADGEQSGAQDFSAMLATYEKESAASRQEG